MSTKKTKQTEQKAGQASGYWNAEKIGDQIEGKFGGWFESKFGIAMMVGKQLISLSKTALASMFVERYETLNGETEIKIQWTSEAKGRAKQKTKIYSVWIDGEQILRQIGKPAELKSVGDFFRSLPRPGEKRPSKKPAKKGQRHG